MSIFNNINECSPITLFPLGVECISTNTSTPTSTDGSLTLNITGGTPPYDVTWSNGESSPTISNLAKGSYSATIIDYYGDYTATTTCTVGSDTFTLYKFTSCPNSATTIYLSSTTTNLTVNKIYQLSNFTTGSCVNIVRSYTDFLRIGSPAQLSSPLYLGVKHFTNGTSVEYYYSNGNIYEYQYPSVTNWGTFSGSFDGPQQLAVGQDLTCNGVTYDASISAWIGYPNISYQGKTYTLWILPAVGILSVSEGIQTAVLCCNDSVSPNCWTYLGQELYTAQTISNNSSYFYDFDTCVECNPSLSDVPDTICLQKGIKTSPTPTPTVTPTITTTPTVTPSITPSTSPNNLVSFYSCCGYQYFNVNTTETVFPIIPNVGDTQIVVFTNESSSNPFLNNKCFTRVAFNPSFTLKSLTSAGAVVFDNTVYASCEICDGVSPCIVPSQTSTPTNTPTPTITPSVTQTSTPTLTPFFTPSNTPTNTPTPSITPTITTTPTSTPTPTPTDSTSYLLQEDGFYLLQEDGERITI